MVKNSASGRMRCGDVLKASANSRRRSDVSSSFSISTAAVSSSQSWAGPP